MAALSALAKQWQQHASEGLWVLRTELQLRCAAVVRSVRAALQEAPGAVLLQADMEVSDEFRRTTIVLPNCFETGPSRNLQWVFDGEN